MAVPSFVFYCEKKVYLFEETYACRCQQDPQLTFTQCRAVGVNSALV